MGITLSEMLQVSIASELSWRCVAVMRGKCMENALREIFDKFGKFSDTLEFSLRWEEVGKVEMAQIFCKITAIKLVRGNGT
jgi:hypothetical protein